VLYLGTRGGASLLNMEDSLGSLEAGKLADLLLVDMTGHHVTLDNQRRLHYDFRQAELLSRVAWKLTFNRFTEGQILL